MPDDVHLINEVQSLRARRLLRTLAVVQDLSDALMAVNDVTGWPLSAALEQHVEGCCIDVTLPQDMSCCMHCFCIQLGHMYACYMQLWLELRVLTLAAILASICCLCHKARLFSTKDGHTDDHLG